MDNIHQQLAPVLLPHKNQDRWIGYIIKIIGWLITLVASLIQQGLPSILKDNNKAINIAIVVLLGLLIVRLGSYISRRISRRASRMLLKDGAAILKKDGRNPILYLRPFTNDGSKIHRCIHPNIIRRIVNAPTYEEVFSQIFKDTGPVIAVGNPADDLPPSEMLRIYLRENWQSAVEILTVNSQLVLLQIGDSEGILWETRFVLGAIKPQQLILCLAIGVEPEEKRQHLYYMFRVRTSNLFPHPLPETIAESLFIYFDSDWIPYLLEDNTQIGRCADLLSERAKQCSALETLKSKFLVEHFRFRTHYYLRMFFWTALITTGVTIAVIMVVYGLFLLLVGK